MSDRIVPSAIYSEITIKIPENAVLVPSSSSTAMSLLGDDGIAERMARVKAKIAKMEKHIEVRQANVTR